MHEPRVWCIKDVSGYVCVVLVYCFLGFGDYVIIAKLILPTFESSPVGVMFVTSLCVGLAVMATVSHLRCMLSNPGTVPLKPSGDEEAPEMDPNSRTWCKKCKCAKPYQAHHCSICNRCIRKMDHHCPWVNNCVGARNTKFFLLFLLNVCCTAILAFSLMVTRIVKCAQNDWAGNCSQIMNDSMWLGGLFVVSLLFGLFTGGMFIDMIMSIRSNTTAIDKLKHQYGEKRPFCVNLEEVFGEPASIRWVLPCYTVESEREPPHRGWGWEGVGRKG